MQGVTKVDNSEEVSSQAAQHLISDPMTTSQKSFGAILSAASALDAADDNNRIFPKSSAQPNGRGPVAAKKALRFNANGSIMSAAQNADYEAALEIWAAMTFVRMDFFTAEEAIAYVDYFYDHLQPMSPVYLPDYRDVRKHHEFLTNEPILVLTILTIASRYMELKGPSNVTRQFTIHHELWKNLTSKIQRLFWGQEQFGGGRSGAGRVREMPGGQLTWPGSLRTLGTVEALLLLTDWQPRSVHLPPGLDDISLLDKRFEQIGVAPGTSKDNMPAHFSWLEPAWRSDRMSWMILSQASFLAFELGVFDDELGRIHGDDPDFIRKQRIRRMVTVYVSQTSGRLGNPSPLDFESGYDQIPVNALARDQVDTVHDLWTHIAGIMHQANQEIFPSRDYTMKLTRGHEYRDRIEKFAPKLSKWMEHYSKVQGNINPIMQCILLMEYEYSRLYINSIGLQHVVESWVRPGGSNQRSISDSMAKAVGENKHYIDEFTEASLHILQIVGTTMNNLGVIRDAPVRTFLRTLSAMMFTIKVSHPDSPEKRVLTSVASKHGQSREDGSKEYRPTRASHLAIQSAGSG
jgi:hypothetical protein